jgi:hypothetical protein
VVVGEVGGLAAADGEPGRAAQAAVVVIAMAATTSAPSAEYLMGHPSPDVVE